jgi:hypothetical protein
MSGTEGAQSSRRSRFNPHHIGDLSAQQKESVINAFKRNPHKALVLRCALADRD